MPESELRLLPQRRICGPRNSGGSSARARERGVAHPLFPTADPMAVPAGYRPGGIAQVVGQSPSTSNHLLLSPGKQQVVRPSQIRSGA